MDLPSAFFFGSRSNAAGACEWSGRRWAEIPFLTQKASGRPGGAILCDRGRPDELFAGA